jgi:hypothetical protein
MHHDAYRSFIDWELILVFGLVAPLLYQFWRLASLGRQMATYGPLPYLVEDHRDMIPWIIGTLLVALFVIDVPLRGSSPHPGNVSQTLLAAHLTAGALWIAIGATMRLYATGLRHPRTHRVLARVFYALLAFIIATGTTMVVQLS